MCDLQRVAAFEAVLQEFVMCFDSDYWPGHLAVRRDDGTVMSDAMPGPVRRAYQAAVELLRGRNGIAPVISEDDASSTLAARTTR